MQRRRSVQILGRHVCPRVDQQLAHLQVPPCRRAMQRTPSVFVFGVNVFFVAALLQQSLHHFVLSIIRRQVQVILNHICTKQTTVTKETTTKRKTKNKKRKKKKRKGKKKKQNRAKCHPFGP
jgi:hypothetical protein